MLVATNLSKSYAIDGGQWHALNGISFAIPKGCFFTLLGPSGCGKTTTLRSIAGLERPNAGSIEIAGRKVFDSNSNTFVAPDKRNIGMVFQSYAIWPHMNAFDNVAFPLQVRANGSTRDEVRRKVARALETVQLGGYEKRPATRLSGGEQQRLALARALIMEPDLLLLDEPLSNLDAKLRETLRIELRRLQREVGITTVYVTHDQTEALALSDEVAVMHKGKIVQLSDPQTLYNRPASRFVASFIGSTNILEGTVQARPDRADQGIVDTACGRLRCLFSEIAPATQNVCVSIRPETMTLVAMDESLPAHMQNVMEGRVTERVFLGEVIDYVVAINQVELRIRRSAERSFAIASTVKIGVQASHCLALSQ